MVSNTSPGTLKLKRLVFIQEKSTVLVAPPIESQLLQLLSGQGGVPGELCTGVKGGR